MLETGKHYCQCAYIFINEIVQAHTKRNTQWDITTLVLYFFTYIMWHPLKSERKSSFQSSSLIFLHDYCICLSLPWVPYIDIIYFQSTLSAPPSVQILHAQFKGSFQASPWSLPRSHQCHCLGGRVEWPREKAQQPDCLGDLWANDPISSSFSVFLWKMEIVIIAPVCCHKG